MATVESIKCEFCDAELKGKLALYNHQKKYHAGMVQSSKKTEVQSAVTEEVPVKEEVKVVGTNMVSEMKQEGIEMLKSFCRTSLVDVDHKRTFDKICEQMFLETYIPFGIGEGEGAVYEAGINGVLFVIPKGTRVVLPKSFVDEVFAQQKIKGFDDYKISDKNPQGKLTSVRV